MNIKISYLFSPSFVKWIMFFFCTFSFSYSLTHSCLCLSPFLPLFLPFALVCSACYCLASAVWVLKLLSQPVLFLPQSQSLVRWFLCTSQPAPLLLDFLPFLDSYSSFFCLLFFGTFKEIVIISFILFPIVCNEKKK